MNTSSFLSFAQSAFLSSALVITLASCEKENVQPKDSSASTYETSSNLRQKEIVMPGAPDHKIVREDGGLDMKQVGLNENISTDGKKLGALPDLHSKFRQIGSNEDVSTQSSERPGTPDQSKFRQIGSSKNYSTLSDDKPAKDRSKFRKTGLSKDYKTL